MHQVTGTLRIVRRLPSSFNGNPRYLVDINGEDYRTAPDAMLAYGIERFDQKRVTAEVRTLRGKLTLITVEFAE